MGDDSTPMDVTLERGMIARERARLAGERLAEIRQRLGEISGGGRPHVGPSHHLRDAQEHAPKALEQSAVCFALAAEAHERAARAPELAAPRLATAFRAGAARAP